MPTADSILFFSVSRCEGLPKAVYMTSLPKSLRSCQYWIITYLIPRKLSKFEQMYTINIYFPTYDFLYTFFSLTNPG